MLKTGMEIKMRQEKYIYKNLPIPGGGYVTGFAFHPTQKNVMYIRTDIGGTYRYDYDKQVFVSLDDHVTMEDPAEAYPIALALCASNPGKLYIACGTDDGQNGVFAVSDDYGVHFTYHKLPTPVHGNWNGRGVGARLICDESDDQLLWFASPRNGLWKTTDGGIHWKRQDVGGEDHMTFVFRLPGTTTLIVGTAGVTTAQTIEQSKDKTAERDELGDLRMRGTTLYISYDLGEHFEVMKQPKSVVVPTSRMSGYVAHRYSYDGRYLYITLNNTGEYSYVIETGYSCDSGHTLAGIVLRYEFDNNGNVKGYEDITPVKPTLLERYGYGGISSCKDEPGLLALATITRNEGDIIYRSHDYGSTWEIVLEDLRKGSIQFKTPYMKPKYNGEASIVHWPSDIQINPTNSSEVWFNGGSGVFGSRNFMYREPIFTDYCEGLEETVHLNIYSPTSGKVQLVDILGDLGGFAFEDISKPCENSFADSEGNRYITCINADIPDHIPEYVAVTPRGNWKGKTKGGLIVSKDQGKSFERIPLPFGLTEELDNHFHDIEHPNVNSGWIAVSADARSLVWSIAHIVRLPIRMVICSQDGGKTFSCVKVWNLDNIQVTEGYMKVYSDREDASIFYGFDDQSHIYVSMDSGRNFYEKAVMPEFAGMDFGWIDCANKTEIRGEAGKSGTFYIAAGEHGLWKMVYDRNTDCLVLKRLSAEGDRIYCIGLGLKAPDSDYFNDSKALYVCANLSGEYGFFRSTDDGKSYTRLNTDQQMYGIIQSIEGDCRTYGRFYIATGTRGVLWGDLCE